MNVALPQTSIRGVLAPKTEIRLKLFAVCPISAAIALTLLAQSLLVEAGAPQLTAFPSADSWAAITDALTVAADADATRTHLDALRGEVRGKGARGRGKRQRKKGAGGNGK